MSDPVTRLKAARSGRSVGRFRVSVHSTRFEVSGLGLPWLPRVVQAVRRDAGRTSAPVPPP